MPRVTARHLVVSMLSGVAFLLKLFSPSSSQAQAAQPVHQARWQGPPAARREPVLVPQGTLASPWSSLDYGLGIAAAGSCVDAIATSGGDVYAGGLFLDVCFNFACSSTSRVNRIARWNANGWSGLANGFSAAVYALVLSGGDLYAGGIFFDVCDSITCLGESEINYIARWEGGSWVAVGNGLNDAVKALAASDSDLYAGGDFIEACGNETCDSGNSPARHIARWNGSSWSALGNGLNDNVYALAVSGGDLYAGGDFTQICGDAACSAGNTPANHVAKWNGSSWSALGNGVGTLSGRHAVNALAVRGTTIYAGGNFKEACGDATCTSGNTTVNYIAAWDGTGWSALRDGVDSDVYALAVSGNDLYVGGIFFDVCGSSACNSPVLNTPVYHIARWDGSFWWDLRYGVNDWVLSLAVTDSTLYVGGVFAQICATGGCTPGATVNNIAAYSLPTPLPTSTGTVTDTPTLTPTFTQTPAASLTATATATSAPTLTDTASATTAPTPSATSTSSTSATATDTVPASSPTPTRAAELVGDCDGNGSVSIANLVTLVNIALTSQPVSACPHGIPAGQPVDIALIIQAVNNALNA